MERCNPGQQHASLARALLIRPAKGPVDGIPVLHTSNAWATRSFLDHALRSPHCNLVYSLPGIASFHLVTEAVPASAFDSARSEQRHRPGQPGCHDILLKLFLLLLFDFFFFSSCRT